MSTPLSTNEVQVEKLVYGGEGLSRVEGRVVLTPFVLPGETAVIEPAEVKKDVVRGRLVEVKSPSAERVVPKCPYFGRCGGCDYQHSAYEYQLKQKVEILREVMKRIGRIDAPEQIDVVAGEPWEYRNRSQFRFDRAQIGYMEEGSHKLCPIDHCPISSPKINEAIKVFRSMLHTPKFPRFLRVAEVFTNERDVQLNVLETDRPIAKHFFEWFADRMPGTVAGPLDYFVSPFMFRVSGKSFFQVNRFLISQLVETVLRSIPEEGQGSRAVDLYAGVGLFTLPLARRFRQVTAVESGAAAAEDLSFNIQRANKQVQSIRQQVESFLMEQEKGADFVVADPPRAGLGKLVVKELVRLQPARIVIVACDPSTLARDLTGLLAGGYAMDRMTLVDLFPQTYHMETVVELTHR